MRWWPAVVILVGCSGADPGPPGGEPRVLEGPLVGQGLAVAEGALWVSAPDLDGSGGVYGFEGGAGDRTLAQAAVALTASGPGDAGAALAVCDLDADGQLDLVAGAPDRDESGGVWLLHAPTSADLAGQPFAAGLRDGGHSGAAVACGDIDGDGRAEIAASAPDTDSGGVAVQTGTVDVFEDDAGAPKKLANLETTFSDSHLGFRTGLVLGADLDGDGLGDLATAAWGADRLHLLFGDLAGSISAVETGITLTGEDGEGTGHALAAGDIDGDGALDLVAGRPLAGGESGGAWVLKGPFSEADDGLIRDRAGTHALDGVQPGDQAGFSVAFAGDVDGDGAEDLLIGAPFAGGVGPEAGAAYLVLGPAEVYGNLDSAEAILLGDVARGRLGWAVAGGDLDADGLAELVVGAPEADVGGAIGVGSVFVFPGTVRGVAYPDDAAGRIDR